MEKYPFVKCLNPQHIKNPYTKESMIVGCGKCEACLLQKSSMRSLKCKLESMAHKYTYFVTLTYRNDAIPRMIPYLVSSITNIFKREHLYYFLDNSPRAESPMEEVLAEVELSHMDLDILLKKVNLDGAIPYLCKRDVQLFMKRLRKHLSKYTDEKIRYYLVGEYGPEHFRPHFHLLIWFSERETQEVLHSCIYKSWPFGRIDIQESKGQSSNYVAGYLNGSNSLPRIFKACKTKPFACHSQFLGEKILRKEKEEVYATPVKEFVQRSLNVNGSATKFSVWRSFTSAFFPRCPKFATLTHDERLSSYRTYGAASEVCKQVTPFCQAKEIVDDIMSGLKTSIVHEHFKKKYNIHPYHGQTDYDRQIRRVYLELRISQHFIHFCCDGIETPIHQDSTLLKIESFHSEVERLNLSNQLKTINEFLKYDAIDVDDIEYFYDNRPFDKDKFQKNTYFKRFREKTMNTYRNSMKHKWQNDKNKYFDNL